jgi:beta-N-acetylglucosaminidase
MLINDFYAKAASQTGTITAGKTNVYFRESPGGDPVTDSNGANIMLNGGQSLEILDTTNSSWYKVTLVYKKTTYTGYVSSQFVTLDSASGSNDTVQTTESASSDSDFEAYLTSQGFPESYKPQLRALHELYPNWIFKAVNTGLDWNTVVDNEINKAGQIKNLVQGTSVSPHYNWRSTTVGYNIKTDTWSSYDGSNWFAASDELVTYYLDPRVYLYERFIFAFETLAYDSSQTKTGVESILAGTFMYNTKPSGYSYTYSDLIMKAGKAAGISPYHIASRIKQEVGTSLSYVTNGKHDVYPGIYNFYNIGGYDSATGNAVTNALKWAATGTTYGRPWNNVYKSIYGGAQYIGNNYILKNQNTLYTEKFNVTNTANLYSHQYMSNVQAVSSEASKVYNAYAGAGTLNDTITFCIPVYNNMPDTMVSKPEDSGNPNNYLKSLSVSGYSLTPTFDVNSTKKYSLIVPDSVSSIEISASPVSSSATVSGTGTVSLSKGTNTVKISVTAQNGNKRTYKLTIVRGASSGNSTSEASFNGGYVIGDDYITGVAVSTTVSSFISNLGCTNGTVKIIDSSDAEKTSGNIATGDTVKITVSGNTETYKVVIYGDVNGDGSITALDLLRVQKYLIGSIKLKGAYLTAANIKKSGSPSALDLLKIQKYIMGAASIEQK